MLTPWVLKSSGIWHRLLSDLLFLMATIQGFHIFPLIFYVVQNNSIYHDDFLIGKNYLFNCDQKSIKYKKKISHCYSFNRFLMFILKNSFSFNCTSQGIFLNFIILIVPIIVTFGFLKALFINMENIQYKSVKFKFVR